MPEVPDHEARKRAHDIGKAEIEKRYRRLGLSEKESRKRAEREQNEASRRADAHWEEVKRGR